ncbi:VanZ family protein [Aquimarina sp. M1]
MLALAYTGLVGWLSLAIIFIPIDIKVEGSDKIGHLLAYFVFTVIWFLFFFYSEKQPREFSKSITKASVLSFLFGILMELLQGTVTDYRSPEWNDVLANTSGIVFAIIVVKVLKNKLVNLHKK